MYEGGSRWHRAVQVIFKTFAFTFILKVIGNMVLNKAVT
jgi:hypothetical protein